VCASGCDYSSIKSAIAAPTTLDGDTLGIAAGTYTEAGIVVDKSLTLQGEDAATTIVQAAATPNTAPDRVFTIPSGISVTIRELTIRYGVAPYNWGGGGLYNYGTLTLINNFIRGNSATQTGGIENSGTLTLINSTVSGNVAKDGDGGGIVNAGSLMLANSTVSGNAATSDGGGIENYPDTAEGTTLTNSTISGNAATRGGGLASTRMLTLANSLVANNPHGGNCFNYAFSGSAPITSQGYDLDSDGSCQLTEPTDQPGVGQYRLLPLIKAKAGALAATKQAAATHLACAGALHPLSPLPLAVHQSAGCGQGGTRNPRTSRTAQLGSGRPAASAGVWGRQRLADPVPLGGKGGGTGRRKRACGKHKL
jgi:hypothetical protein